MLGPAQFGQTQWNVVLAAAGKKDIALAEQSWLEINTWCLRLPKELDEAFASRACSSARIPAGSMPFLLNPRREMVMNNRF